MRKTLQIIKQYIPLEIYEVPTGTQVFDWTIPKEWNIKDAYIKNAKGQKIVNFANSNLHVVNYSIPVHTKISLQELKAIYSHCPSIPTGFPIEPPTTKKVGDFA